MFISIILYVFMNTSREFRLAHNGFQPLWVHGWL